MNDRQKDKEYADHLKECISHREEQIVAMHKQLKAKDDIIDDMRHHIMSSSDDKIAELLAKVEKLTAVVEKATKDETIETEKSQKVQNRHSAEDKLKSTFAWSMDRSTLQSLWNIQI